MDNGLNDEVLKTINIDFLYEELSEAGPFPKDEQGVLLPETLLKLSRIINMHSKLSFV